MELVQVFYYLSISTFVLPNYSTTKLKEKKNHESFEKLLEQAQEKSQN